MTEPDDPDMLAAEYVLGSLDAAERADVAARLGTDVELALAVQAWEARLAPLLDRVVEVEPPADAYGRLAARLFGPTPRPSVPGRDGAVEVLRRRVRLWRGAAAGFALLAASLLAWIAVREPATPPGSLRLAAVLQRDPGAPAMLIEVDLAARRLTVRQLDAAAPAGRIYELWIIDPALGAPRSLGPLAAHADAERSLDSYSPAVITGATYAVTVEPPGGSPTGQPSAAPVLTGRLAGR